jgi:predicted nucleotidyltransferase
MDIYNRAKNLEDIKKVLLKCFDDQILCAIVYGSTLNSDFCSKSDYDILLVFQEATVKTFNLLRNIKQDFVKNKLLIDFNVHLANELPIIRKELFWHNNRGIYVQKEFELYGKVLIGENCFKMTSIDQKLMLEEAVKVINSLNYQARKLFINKGIDSDENKILIIKLCIYGALYALAAKNIFPENRAIAMDIFHNVFNPKISPTKFMRLKQNPTEIKQKDMHIAYDFLLYLDNLIFEEYQQQAKK